MPVDKREPGAGDGCRVRGRLHEREPSPAVGCRVGGRGGDFVRPGVRQGQKQRAGPLHHPAAAHEPLAPVAPVAPGERPPTQFSLVILTILPRDLQLRIEIET